MNMCRFPTKEDTGYKQVSGELRLILGDIGKKREQKES